MLLDRVNTLYGKFGLNLSTEKTEIMHSQIDGRRNVSIDVNGAALKSVESFKYLGSYLSEDCSLDKEIEIELLKLQLELFLLNRRGKKSSTLTFAPVIIILPQYSRIGLTSGTESLRESFE